MMPVIRVGSILGIPIRPHFTWLFVFFLVAWSVATRYLPSTYEGWTKGQYWTVGIGA